ARDCHLRPAPQARVHETGVRPRPAPRGLVGAVGGRPGPGPRAEHAPGRTRWPAFTKRGSGTGERLEGSWELSEAGPGRTHPRYTLAVDPGKVGLMARPLERALRPIVVGQRPA